MTFPQSSVLGHLLRSVPVADHVLQLLQAVEVPQALREPNVDGVVTPVFPVRAALIAAALDLLLFADLMQRVPTAKRYVEDCSTRGRRIMFDHGAVRTVARAAMGNLPGGEEAMTRLLLPLGYERSGMYPLERLGMTGRSYTHREFAASLPQFFVSELHVERFSPAFQATVAAVTADSRDPLTAEDQLVLQQLQADGFVPFAAAFKLIPALLACFRRQHSMPTLEQYETLLAESAEMAWISTEGNAFNHATDRVGSLDKVVDEQRRLHRPLKDVVEVSRSGRVRQTAFIADRVEREFATGGVTVRRLVPGSFYEFIQRDPLRSGDSALDLSFDSGNAQGIFKMTAAA